MRLPKWLDTFFIVSFSLVLVIIFAFLDYATGIYFSFQIFYLIPVCVVAWFCDRRLSYIPLIFSVLAWFFDDILRSEALAHPLVPYWNVFVKAVFFAVIVHLLSRLKETLHREEVCARVDYLTGISNKRNFSEAAEREIGRSKRYKRPLTLAYIDIDNFKRVNDKYGHAAGDKLLRITAHAFMNNVRVSDVVARMGGDEFAILFPETDYDTAKKIIQRIRKVVHHDYERKRWPATLSVGVVTSPTGHSTVDSLLADADKLLYEVKKRGKNAVEHGLAKEPSR